MEWQRRPHEKVVPLVRFLRARTPSAFFAFVLAEPGGNEEGEGDNLHRDAEQNRQYLLRPLVSLKHHLQAHYYPFSCFPSHTHLGLLTSLS